MAETAVDGVQRIDADVIRRLIEGYTPGIIRRDPESALPTHQDGMAGADTLAQIMAMNQAPPSIQHDEQHLNSMMRHYDDQIEGSTDGSLSSSHHLEVGHLPLKPLDESMMDVDGTAYCTICREEVPKGMKVKVMYCSHWFHVLCLDAWLLEPNDSCPVCRMPIQEAKEKFWGGRPPVLAVASGGRGSPVPSGREHRPPVRRWGGLWRLWTWAWACACARRRAS